MSFSSRAQRVSRRLPARGTTGSCENSPSQRRPETMRTSSAASSNAQTALTRATSALQARHQKSASKNASFRQLPFRRVCSARRALRGLRPRQTLSDPIFLQRIEPTKFDERTYELGESLVPQRPAHDRVRLGYIVPLAVRCRVAVRVRNKRIRGRDVVRFRECHQVVTLDAAYLSVGKPGRRVEESEQDATGGPRKLVS